MKSSQIRQLYKRSLVRQVKLQGSTSASLEVQAFENRIADVSKKVQNRVRAIESGNLSDAVSDSLSENERILAALRDELAKAKLLQESGSLTEEKICYFFEKIAQKAKETEKYKIYYSRLSSGRFSYAMTT